jgi:acyl carrier protein
VTEEQFALMFHDALGEVLESIPDGVELDTEFGDLDIDSLSRMEIITILEGKMKARINDSVLQNAKTGRDLFCALAGVPVNEGA